MSRVGTGPEVWLVDTDRAAREARELEAAVPRLSLDERQRAERAGQDGERWLALRIVMRVLLERHAGPRLRGLPLARGSAGKPGLPWPSGIEFSLSHCGAYGLIAIGRGPVGIDIEQSRELHFPGRRHEAILSAAAALSRARPRQAGGALPAPQAWARLEALGKARGSGVGALLDEIGITRTKLGRLEAEDCARTAAELIRDGGFEVADVELPAGLHGAIAFRPADAPAFAMGPPPTLSGLERLGEPAPLPVE